MKPFTLPKRPNGNICLICNTHKDLHPGVGMRLGYPGNIRYHMTIGYDPYPHIFISQRTENIIHTDEPQLGDVFLSAAMYYRPKEI